MPRKKHINKSYKSIDPNVLRKKEKDRIALLFDKIKQEEKNRQKEKDVAVTNEVQEEKISLDESIQQTINEDIKKTEKCIIQTHNIEIEKPSSAIKYDFKPEQEDPLYYIVSNNRLSSMLDYENILEKYVEMIKNIEDQYQFCLTKLSETERELQDFLHELRMPKKNAYEGFKIYQLGHHLEIKRQAYKDAIRLLGPIFGHVKCVRDNLENIERLVTNLKELDNLKNNRIYMPRSDLKLSSGDKFRKLSKKEQEILRQKYEAAKRQKY